MNRTHSIFDGQYVGAGKEVTEDNLPGAKQVMTGVPAPPVWLQSDRAAQMQPTDVDLNPAEYMIGEWTKRAINLASLREVKWFAVQ